MNLNELARAVCKIEGGKTEVNIAQVKDVLNALGQVLAEMPPYETLQVFAKLVKIGMD